MLFVLLSYAVTITCIIFSYLYQHTNTMSLSIQHHFCDTCYTMGHRYKDCNHPNILPIHKHLLAMHIEHRATRSSAPSIERPRTSNIVRSLPVSLCRTLIVQYTPDDCKTTDYTNITAWKNRPHEEKYKLPSRLTLLSRMSISSAHTMIGILYEHLAIKYLHDYPHSDPAKRMRIHEFQNNLRYELNRIGFRLLRNNNQSLAHAVESLSHLQSVTHQATADMNVIHDQRRQRPTNRQTRNDFLRGVDYQRYCNHSNTEVLFRTLIIPEPDYAPMTPPMEDEDDEPMTPPPAPARRRMTSRPPQAVQAFEIAMEKHEGEPPAAECGICWEATNKNTLCSTNCNHNFCMGCITQQAKTAKTKLQCRMAREHVPRRERTPELTCALCRAQVNTLNTWADSESTPTLELGLVLHSTCDPSALTDIQSDQSDELLNDALNLLTNLNSDEFIV